MAAAGWASGGLGENGRLATSCEGAPGLQREQQGVQGTVDMQRRWLITIRMPGLLMCLGERDFGCKAVASRMAPKHNPFTPALSAASFQQQALPQLVRGRALSCSAAGRSFLQPGQARPRCSQPPLALADGLANRWR